VNFEFPLSVISKL